MFRLVQDHVDLVPVFFRHSPDFSMIAVYNVLDTFHAQTVPLFVGLSGTAFIRQDVVIAVAYVQLQCAELYPHFQNDMPLFLRKDLAALSSRFPSSTVKSNGA